MKCANIMLEKIMHGNLQNISDKKVTDKKIFYKKKINEKVYLLDPGLSFQNGNNFDGAMKIALQFIRKKYKVYILSNKNINKQLILKFKKYNICVIPTFTVSPVGSFCTYDSDDHYSFSIEQTKKELIKFQNTYEKGFISIWLKPSSIVHMIANLFCKISVNNIFLYDLNPRNFLNCSIKLYQKYNGLFSERNDIHYLTGDDFSKEIINCFININTIRFPQISDSYNIQKVNLIQKKSVGIFGIEELLVNNLLDETISFCNNLDLKIFVQDNKNLIKGDLSSSKKINFFKFENQISNIFEQVDFGIYYFNPIRYKLMVSGIVNEAISYGFPIIVPHSNLANKTLGNYNCEFSFDWKKKEELFNHIKFFFQNHEAVLKSFYSASQAWNKREGSELLVKKILKKIKEN